MSAGTLLKESEREREDHALPPEEVEVSSVPEALVVLFYGLMFFSGTAGLVYEVLWAERLGVLFGHSTLAITTVLVAFMAGMGLGSWIFGRLVDRWRRPLWAYACIELALAAAAAVAFLAIPPLRGLHAAFYGVEPGMHLGHYVVRFCIAFGVLLPPTLLMGATLPVLSRALTRSDRQIGVRPGRLYGFNTLGALVGCVLAGFVLLPFWGQWGTLVLAVAFNLGVGLTAVWVETRWPVRLSVDKAPAAHTPLPGGLTGDLAARRVVILGASFLSGLCLFSYEISWSRLVSLLVNSSAFSFSTMLATVLAGITLGSLVAARVQKNREPRLWWLGAIFVGGAVTVFPLFWLVDSWPLLAVVVRALLGNSPGVMVGVGLVVCAMLFFPPSVIIGMTFPVATRLYTKAVDRLGKSIGLVYAVNTAGAILGAAVTGLLLIPTIGLQESLILSSVILVLGAAILVCFSESVARWGRGLAATTAAALAVLLCTTTPWDRVRVDSGAMIYAGFRTSKLAGGLEEVDAYLHESKLLYHRDGISASVAVMVDENGGRNVRTNGKVDASDGLDMSNQLLTAYLPLLARPEADRALLIGFGSGVTLGAVTQGRYSTIHCVEMEPAMVESYRFFQHVNQNCLDDPRVQVFINDGRNHIETVRQTYDVIVTEPSNPWIAGIATLFTSEFYELCKKRLAPGGIVAQWLQIYLLEWDTYRMVLATYAEQFPHVLVFIMTGGDTLLLGSEEPILFDVQAMDRLLESRPLIRQNLARYTPVEDGLSLLRHNLVLTTEGVRTVTRGVETRNRDHHLRLQYEAAWSLSADSMKVNQRKLLGAQPIMELPLARPPDKTRLADPGYLKAVRGKAKMSIEMGRFDFAEELLRHDLEIDPHDNEAHFLLAQILERAGQSEAARAHFEASGATGSSARTEDKG